MKILPFPIGSSIEPLEPRIAPSGVIASVVQPTHKPHPLVQGPALVVDSVKVIAPNVAVPGEPMVFSCEISNVGTETNVEQGIHIFVTANPDDVPNSATTTLLHEFSGVVKIPPGVTELYRAIVTLPQLNFPMQSNSLLPGNAYLMAYLPYTGDYDPSHYSESKPFDLEYQFGSVGGLKQVYLMGSDGYSNFLLGLKGPGTGTLTLSGSNPTVSPNFDVSFSGTTGASSALGVSQFPNHKPAYLPIEDITGDPSAALGSLMMPTMDVTGDLSFPGGLNTLKLHDIGSTSGIGEINIGGSAPASVTMNYVTSMDLNASAGLKLLSVASWINSGAGAGTITAPFIAGLVNTGSVESSGSNSFGAGLDLTGVASNGFTLGRAVIVGTLSGATWDISGSGGINAIRASVASDWRLDSAQGVNEIAIGGVDGGSLDALYFGKLSFMGAGVSSSADETASITATGTARADAIKTLDATTLQNVTVDANAGTVGHIDVRGWTSGSLTCGPIYKTQIGLGGLNGATFDISGAPKGGTGDLNILGVVTNSTINTSQPLNLTFGGMTAGSVLNAFADIPSFCITGKHGGTFSASDINAAGYSMGTVVLENVDASTSLPLYWIKTDFVKNYTRTEWGITEFHAKDMSPGSPTDTDGNYSLVLTNPPVSVASNTDSAGYSVEGVIPR